MARRRLETAIYAGRAIEQGKEWPDTFSKIEVIHEIKLDHDRGGIYCLQFSYDGEQLAVGYSNGAVDLLSVKTGSLIHALRPSRYGGLQVMSLRFNPKVNNVLFASMADGLIYACDTETGTSKEIVTEKGNEINCLDFSLDGFNFATGGKDLNVRIYDSKTYKLLHMYEGYNEKTLPHEMQSIANTQRVFALRYHPMNDDIFVTGGWENHLKIWDARSSDGVKRTIWGPHICGDSLDLKEYKILTGSWMANNSLQLWNYTEGKLEKNVPFPCGEHGGFLYCAQFCDNDTLLAGGSGTNSVEAVNMTTGEHIASLKMSRPVHAMDSTMGGRLFAVGGAEDCLKIARLC